MVFETQANAGPLPWLTDLTHIMFSTPHAIGDYVYSITYERKLSAERQWEYITRRIGEYPNRKVADLSLVNHQDRIVKMTNLWEKLDTGL